MLKKTITYIDFDDNERTEDFYFNLTKAELTEMEVSTSGGLTKLLEKLISEKDNTKIVDVFKDLVLRSYGEKSPDGRRFIKNQEVKDAFAQTQAYSDLFMELSTSAGAATIFVNGIIPEALKDKVET